MLMQSLLDIRLFFTTNRHTTPTNFDIFSIWLYGFLDWIGKPKGGTGWELVG